jgi:hypothetical protein
MSKLFAKGYNKILVLILCGICFFPSCLTDIPLQDTKVSRSSQEISSPVNSANRTETPTVTNMQPQLTKITIVPTKAEYVNDDQGSSNIVSFEDIPNGEYLLIVDKWAGENEALKIIDLNGDLIGTIDAGKYYRYAQISPDNKWLAFVDGYSSENSSLYLKSLTTEISEKISDHCTQVAWAETSLKVAAGCNNRVVVFEYLDNTWKQSGILPQPVEGFTKIPQNKIEYYFPSWSPDGSELAYFGRSIVSGSVKNIGPYISTTSCLWGGDQCTSKSLDIQFVDYLTWSHTRSEIVVHIFDHGNSKIIFLDPLAHFSDSAELHLVKNGFTIESMVVSIQGDQIAYRSDYNELCVYNLLTKESKCIFEGEGYETLQVFDWINIHEK